MGERDRILATADAARLLGVSPATVKREEATLARVASRVGAACAGQRLELLLGGRGPWPEVLPSCAARATSFRPLPGWIARL
jgi:hypothetical protein